MMDAFLVHVTCGGREEAERIARAVVDGGWAACATVGAPAHSVYRWQGRVEEAEEFPLTLKTTASRYAGLEAEIRRLHSYETPEIVAVPITAGSADYLAWIAANTAAKKP
jgi:periplasmic divalent cation tolerance protein